MSARSVDEALDRFVPPFEHGVHDWDSVLALARAGAPDRGRGRRRARRAVALAVAAVAAVVLIATPAFGLRSLIADLVGRIDVPFASGKEAPFEVKRSFYDLGLGAPPSMSPGAIPEQARRVATFRLNGRDHVLWVAPTRKGGYCWQFSGWFGGCRWDRTIPKASRPLPGYVHPGLLGVTYQSPFKNRVQAVSLIGGDLRSSAVNKLVLRYADGSSADVRFYFVSKPIDAGFFFQRIPAGHDTEATRTVALEALDASGTIIARQPFTYATVAQRTKALARARARMEAFKRSHRGHQVGPSAPRTVGTPSAPVQKAQADGVTVAAGKNGVVVFDLSHASPAAKKLLGKRGVSYGCFRRLPYHPDPVDFGFYYRITSGRAVIRMANVPAPYDGCDIQGGYGHTWPDRNDSHSAVELAFTDRGGRFFEDRAAARDLALFARSPAMHKIRKLEGAPLERALRERYGSKLTRLSSPDAAIAPRKLGYTIAGDSVTFVERSTTGRRFHAQFVHGHLRGQNVRPLSLVF